MTVSESMKAALDRNESIIIEILKVLEKIPDIVPLKNNIEEQLNNLRFAIQGLRSPRIMVIGRCKAGKSSLINAICELRVAKINDTKPETGKAEWKKYYYHGTDLLHILDTRGLQETEAPNQVDTASSPFESIMQAVRQECPDVVLFLCKATEVHAAAHEDINICVNILKEIQKKYKRDLPVIGVLTKCDELAPPYVRLPTTNENKNKNIQDQVQAFTNYLRDRMELRNNVKAVIPTVAYAEYEEGRNGLIIAEFDYRWNITELVETMIKYTPRETRGSLARMANIAGFQLTVAMTVVTACTVLAGTVSTNPIPGSSMPVVITIQSFMVMYIGWLSGREFSKQTLQDFMVNFAVGAGADVGMIGIADIALKFAPGFGSLLAAGAAAIATKGLGDAAIAYFLNNGKTETSRG